MKAAVLFALCLCICAAAVQGTSFPDCKRGSEWWWLMNQSVQVRESSIIGSTHISVHFDYVFRIKKVHKIRRLVLKSSGLSISQYNGYVELFSDNSKYAVLANSYALVQKYDGFVFNRKGKTKMETKIKLGTNTIKDKGIRYAYTATRGGFC